MLPGSMPLGWLPNPGFNEALGLGPRDWSIPPPALLVTIIGWLQ